MIRTLFINLAIMISFFFIYHQLFRESFLSRNSPLKKKIAIGCLCGLLCIFLMQFSIKVGTDTRIDLRQIPVMLVALYGGWIPALVSGALIVLARFAIGINTSSLTAFFIMTFSLIGYLIIPKKVKNVFSSSLYMIIYSNLWFSLLMYVAMDNIRTYIYINIFFWVVSGIGGLTAVYMNNYLRKMNQLFKEYKTNSLKDPLTGLNNVRSFDLEINNAVNRVMKNNEKLSMLVIDIDFFKKINDTYGHIEGDEILKQVGKLLLEVARPFDIVSRNGGEEFTVLLIDCPLDYAVNVGERIRNKIENRPFLLHNGEQRISITVSIGAATYPDSTADTDCLYRLADEALYKAKRRGRNQVAAA
ncbi:diguanylate cyclase [Fictibacillus sp. Mic-4]|uniref:diguanylate cyclase n=1 Tax=Fictibacillus sp. Mic-4 TaxID=3132826 RepID=UPI003CEEDE70